MDVLQSLLAFVVAIAILITFHEFGHFWVARLCNVKILRFSIGFGRPLWKRHFGPDRSEFVIAALPLGGYVKMLDEREGRVESADLPRAFNRQPLWKRTLIVVAGPLFNFLFAIAAYWVIYMIGISGLRPFVNEVQPASLAARAGIAAGDEILGVDGARTPTWATVVDEIVSDVIAGREARFRIRNAQGTERELAVDLSRISVDEMAGGRLLEQFGMSPRRPVVPAVIGVLTPGEPAARAGMKSGDRVIAVDGHSVGGWGEWVQAVRAAPGRALQVELQRGTDSINLSVTPEPLTDKDGKTYGHIGAGVDMDFLPDSSLIGSERYGPVMALYKAAQKTGEMAAITLRVLGKMLMGQASVKNLSGPISIAQYAGASAGLGIVAFLGFLAIVSVSLGVLNLLPIPVLDGGHLLYYLIETFKGAPVSEGTQVIGQQVGLALLLGLMALAFYNDILRLVG